MMQENNKLNTLSQKFEYRGENFKKIVLSEFLIFFQYCFFSFIMYKYQWLFMQHYINFRTVLKRESFISQLAYFVCILQRIFPQKITLKIKALVVHEFWGLYTILTGIYMAIDHWMKLLSNKTCI